MIFLASFQKVLENILKYATDLFGPSDLIGILSEHCRDPSLMVRKQVTKYQYLIYSWDLKSRNI